jgi:prepilin-type N-terminal cleavage/methylation domain-containing protein
MMECWNDGWLKTDGAGAKAAAPVFQNSSIPVFHARQRRRGFTLLELVMAIMILSIMMLLSFFCFDAVVQSWEAGIEMSDTLGQADYVMEQLASGLRSAYYPDSGSQQEEYGFQFHDGGEGPEARDAISWVKIGRALVGEDCGFAESPHRVDMWVADGGKNELSGLAVRAWRVDLQLDEFEPSDDAPSIGLSPRVVGFNCRMLDKDQPMKDKEPNWQDEWSYSNCIPKAVEITLYMEPAKERDEPIEVKRIVEIPLFDLSQNPRKKSNTTSGGVSSGGGNTQQRLSGAAGLTGGKPIAPRVGK